MQEKHVSCYDDAKATVEDLLGKEGFVCSESVVEGVLAIVSAVADCQEEGVRLFPEILLLKDWNELKEIDTRYHKVYEGEMDDTHFHRLMKLCSPLAVGGWHIFVVLPDETNIGYGIISAERKETSLPLMKQAIELNDGQGAVYIRNVGGKSVELRGTSARHVISLSLGKTIMGQDDDIMALAKVIIGKIEKDEILEAFIVKILREALNAGHGNLIAVCDEDQMDACLSRMTGGAKIDPPVDLVQLVADDKSEHSNVSSVAIKTSVAAIKAMVNHDGISLFSTTGKLLAFHYIVENNKVVDQNAVGGSRTKAFEALKTLDGVEACFFKSQDGVTKFYSKNG